MRIGERFPSPIYVTRPILPDLALFTKDLEQIWASKALTNHGEEHNELERKLAEVLKVPGVSLFNNGTTALLIALKALDLPMGSEVITTPFTFPATPHCISWNGLKPIFCDIRPDTMTLDPGKIEALINENTSAILGVHVYGFPCDVEAIQKIADRHGLKVIYDGAHAFSTEISGVGIAGFGDVTMFSFHATKLYHTIEGGCLAYRDPALAEKVYLLRNFGIKDEETVSRIGINGKMNELQALLGLHNLELFQAEKNTRLRIRSLYEENLSGIPGLEIPELAKDATDSCQYFVLRINPQQFGITRDQLYEGLKHFNIITRKYFYPLCSDGEPYSALPSANPVALTNANRLKTEVLCLPFYGDLSDQDILQICRNIKYVQQCSHTLV